LNFLFDFFLDIIRSLPEFPESSSDGFSYFRQFFWPKDKEGDGQDEGGNSGRNGGQKSAAGEFANLVPAVGKDGFNTAQKAWWAPKPPCFTFDDLFSPILYDMTDRYPKPQIVPEFASACDNSCNKVLWISEAYHQALFHPRLQALVWFNVAKWEGEGDKWVDWRIGCGDCDAPACSNCITYTQALANPRYSDRAPGPISPLACKSYLPLILKNR